VVETKKEMPAPPADKDGDGIVDAKDKCPEKPEDVDKYQDDDGCPDEMPLVELDKDAGKIRVLVDSLVHYDWNRSHVPAEYLEMLKAVAKIMKVHPEIELLRVEGHTSWTGPAWYNRRLSQRRAERVVERLVEYGVAAKRLKAVGMGYDRLKVRKKGPKYNRVNRRVEFTIESSTSGVGEGQDDFEPEDNDDPTIPKGTF
jgi:outer membrane protein OmpA-like peptidoglycan-associated protein